jgi:hypothetical protein
MPEPLWIYLMALLYFTRLTTCSAIADAFDSASHDQLTRMLQGTWSGHTLLDLALRVLFAVAGGYLIVDDTVVAKPAARLLGEAAWVWSNKDRKVLFGVSVVLLVWTDGQHRVPLAFRVWHKGGVSKYDLALELLSYARNRLKCKPQFVLFDSWYPSKKLLKRIRDYGWYFVCRLKKNRSFVDIARLGLTACSGDSGRDTVENHPTIVCGHACGGPDGARHAASDLPRRLSRL